MTAVQFQTTLNEEVKLTPTAHEQMMELVNSEDDIHAVRIYVSGGGCGGMTYGMTFAEAPTPYDTTFEKDGLKVLVDAVALNYLAGVEIDYVTQGMSSSFVFNNVFAETGGSGTCGTCGAAGGGGGGCG